ncbi:penicillin-insensitive murein endopeptidase [Rhodobacteraceae bacterium DSL-40]|uniref:penicillin-insensitive murein endopeptidase n=1 Tax=Amaricoccus sp. B4 TaxID=3368557 RepID=UPI000DAF3AAA
MIRHWCAAITALIASVILAISPSAADAQDAKALFSRKSTPSPHDPYSIGRHAQGCLAGAVALPESGPTWQAMRLSRNHYWGNPEMIRFVEELSRAATKVGWNGLYVGDLSQPRGGPVQGHASHQIGLDADIWLLPPGRLNLTPAERDSISSLNVRSSDQRSVNGNWTRAHARLLEAAARDPRVNRIFITPPVKLKMCADAPAGDRAWLGKIRPWWGHNTHFHVRLNCPKGAKGCVNPDPVPPGDGCADAVWWVTDALGPPDPKAPKPKPKPPLRLSDLPPQCAQVLSDE